MYQFVPAQETRFWKLFRHLLLPMGIFSGLLSVVAAIAAACGEEVVFWNGPVVGWRGVLVSLAFFPMFTLIFTFTGAWALFLHRRILPAIWRTLFPKP